MITTSDPISDMLTRMRNALTARKTSVSLPYSKVKAEMAEILKSNGFIASARTDGEGTMKQLVLEFREAGTISSLIRVSKPGRRVYTACDDIPLILGGRGIVIVSTSSGIMAGREARKLGLGGELMCKVY